MTKPDRWTRLVDKEACAGQLRDEMCVTRTEAITLLRAEHMAMIRAVRRIRRQAGRIVNITDAQRRAYRQACRDILAYLTERGK